MTYAWPGQKITCIHGGAYGYRGNRKLGTVKSETGISNVSLNEKLRWPRKP